MWRATVRKLSDEENGGQHNIFINAFDGSNAPMRRSIEWGWEGQHIDEESNPVVTDIDKRPMCDIPIFPGQRIWVRVAGEESETITNLNTMDAQPYGHQSYAVTFVYASEIIVPESVANPLAGRLRSLAGELLKLADEIGE